MRQFALGGSTRIVSICHKDPGQSLPKRTDLRTVLGLSQMAARCFFHLYDGADFILDQIGVEVSELDQVPDVLMQTVREMQREQSLEISELERWEVRVVDTVGTVVMTVRLSDLNSLNS